MVSAIDNRRSIRKFLDIPIPEQEVMDIIQSGIKAPSSKNRQPWKYIVLQNESKRKMLDTFREGVMREEHTFSILPNSKQHLAATKHTINIMEKAPVIILAVNPFGRGVLADLSAEERIYETCNVQSIGASIQNMLLAATEKGIGSLWICDIYFAYSELCEWLNEEGELIAAIALGYPDESPKERPRKKIEDVIEWRN